MYLLMMLIVVVFLIVVLVYIPLHTLMKYSEILGVRLHEIPIKRIKKN